MVLKQEILNLINELPYIKRLYKENQRLKSEESKFKKNSCFPAGYYYSPIISVDEITKMEFRIWSNVMVDGIAGIDLRTEEQKMLIEKFSQYVSEIPFTAEKQAKIRYYFDNEYYGYTDGLTLYCMIRHYKPERIIEIGSGFSSTVMLDTNEIFFGNGINLTFIEPHPERLYSLVKETDKKQTTIIQKDVQSISLDFFEKLQHGDILFIDSSHIVKTGSDVNYILFEIMPVLKSGVLIHFHDISYPFEYPKEWVYMGRNWNESYVLRSFLMYNSNFEIILFSNYLHKHHNVVFKNFLLSKNDPGMNLWLMKK